MNFTMDNNSYCDVPTYIANYRCSGTGVFFPLVNEYTWPVWNRGVAYFLGIIWTFLGAAIISDIFMCAVETIRSKTRKIKIQNPNSESGFEEVEIWHRKVADFSLGCIGSSAIEIILPTVLILSKNFDSDELGPCTIFGASALNFLLITAISVVAIPSPDVRTIQDIRMYFVTTGFSIFAYIWLALILLVISPHYVELWEAILTLLFLPLFIAVAYLTDKKLCRKKRETVDQEGDQELTSRLTDPG